MDEQCRLLREIVKINRSSYTPFPVQKNLKIRYEPPNIELWNNHSDVVEHQIDWPKLFYDLYPYNKFEYIQL